MNNKKGGRPSNTKLSFLDNIAKTSHCWLWNGAKDKNGYGLISVKNKLYRVHRLSYEHFVGHIPGNLIVLHRCDNPPCCNPDHLFLGTSKDNTLDMLKKGRHQKLDEETVVRIFNETGSHSKIADKYNVSSTLVGNIKRGERWSWLHLP